MAYSYVLFPRRVTRSIRDRRVAGEPRLVLTVVPEPLSYSCISLLHFSVTLSDSTHATSDPSLTQTAMSNPAKPPERSPIVAAAANAASVTTLLTLSLVTHEYIRILEPLYATAPVQYHLNKVIWSAVILSSLVPTLPKASILVAGILITVLPTSAYWVAAYTARNHDVIWGPVITHLSVLAPILYLGVGVSKLFHVSHDLSLTNYYETNMHNI